MPLKLALGVRGTAAGHRLGAVEGGGDYLSPFQCIPGGGEAEGERCDGRRVGWSRDEAVVAQRAGQGLRASKRGLTEMDVAGPRPLFKIPCPPPSLAS